jgi:enamine deaminase RidA (YjgF/YER057c/UK114 family)
VPQTKHCESGRGTIGNGSVTGDARSGSGGGGVRGGATTGGTGAATSGVAVGVGAGAAGRGSTGTAGFGTTFGGLETGVDGAAGLDGAAGFSTFSGSSFSLRRRRKNDISDDETGGRALGMTGDGTASFSAPKGTGGMVSSPSDRLRTLGIELPPPAKPAGAYSPVVAWNRLAWVSGQIAMEDGKVLHPGLVDRDVPLEVAQDLARRATLQALSALAASLGSIDKVYRFLRVAVYVATSPGFDRPHQVANGATELLIDIFGEDGRPARIAVGVASLPLNAAVEVEFYLATW